MFWEKFYKFFKDEKETRAPPERTGFFECFS